MIHFPVRWFAKRGQALRGGLASRAGLDRIRANHQTWDVYWGINCDNAKSTKTRASSVDIIQWCNILVDVDPISPSPNPAAAAATYDAALRDLLGECYPWIVDTGRGVQLIIQLPPHPLTEAQAKMRARRVVGVLTTRLSALGPVHGCTVDTSCSDLSRVARVPGSTNHKTGRTCTILERGVPLAQDSFATLLSLAESVPSLPETKAVAGPWVSQLHQLPEDVIDFLQVGVSEPGRHKAAFKAAAYLHDVGAAHDAVVEAIQRGASRCRPPLSSSDALRCVANALRKEVHA